MPSNEDKIAPAFEIVKSSTGDEIKIQGAWLVSTLAIDDRIAELTAHFSQLNHAPLSLTQLSWNLTSITALDHLGAQFLWNLWDKRRPPKLVLLPQHEAFFDRLYHLGNVRCPEVKPVSWAWIVALGNGLLSFFDHAADFTRLIGQLGLDLLKLIRQPNKAPWTDISASIYRTGAQALGITALVGFLIGVVLSYLSAQQLKTFGAEIYIVNILGMSIIRELGPLLAAILVAGRSGSAITAQLGVMKVTEELDAMLVMGIPHGFRLIMPRVLALGLVMPLLVVWTDALALLGGMVSAKTSLGLSYGFFINTLPNVVSLPNLWVGVGKGAVFGMLIALTACHFGLRVEPNTTSLGQGTTASVVCSITIVILADAVFAILLKNVGI